MKISRYNKHQLIAESTDRTLLEVLQDVVDGDKVRNQDKIIFPNKAIMNALNSTSIKIDLDPEALKIARLVKSNDEMRASNIAQIKSQYGKQITFDYKCKGIYPPLEHQKIMYNMMVYTDACAPLADPGTCKTGPYLWAIDTRIERGEVKKALVITLSNLLENVQEEAIKQVPHMSTVILDSKAKAEKILKKSYKDPKKNKDYDIYIMNYESAFSYLEMFDDEYFQMVVCDEAHRIGSPTSRQTKVIKEKFENTKYKYIITGSLHSNNVSSFFMPFRVLGADTIPISSFKGWRRRYMYQSNNNEYCWIAAPGAEHEVQKIVGRISVCFKLEDCIDLPGVIYSNRYCRMEPDQALVYKTMRDELVATIKDMCSHCDKKGCDGQCEDKISTKNALTLMGKLHQISAGFYMNTRILRDENTGAPVNMSNVIDFPKNPKLDALLVDLNSIPSDKKVIIWTHWIHAVEMVYKRIQEAFGQDSVITCYGNQNAYEQVELFRKKRFIVANPAKMGVGLNIQFSNYQAFYSASHSYIQFEQAVGRQKRQGQTEKVSVTKYIMKGTVDEMIYKCLDNKKDLSMSLSALSRCL